jgi:NADPH:quinone reductase-like Zn-dependent oxidoreductase
VAPRARIVIVGLVAGIRAELDLNLIRRKRLHLVGTQMRNRPLGEKIAATQEFARHVVPLLEAKALVPVVERVLPVTQAAEAHALMASNEGFGKLVLEVP